MLIFIFLIKPCKAQNYFTNADFEELNLCIEYNQLCSPAAWFYVKPALTPFINPKLVPQPFSGKDLLIVSVENLQPDIQKRSFVYSMLCCPLQKNKKYKLSFFINTNSKPIVGIDFYFREKEFNSTNFSVDTIIPSIHITDSNVINKISGWSLVEYNYTANGYERFCLIGNLNKSTLKFAATQRMNKAGDIFYFIDKINFSPIIPEKICNNFKNNTAFLYQQQLRHTERIELSENKQLPEFMTDTITIPSVYFETDKAILKPAFKKLVSDLLQKFTDKNIAKIDIEGHTDNTGSELHNLQLSKDRAEAVLHYFIQKWPYIKDNIFAFGKAANFPIADNATTQGRSKNRRVQIILSYSTKVKQ